MRLNIHDFSGHPFQVQLSRNLASRGHEVVHSFSTQFVTGHGRLEAGEGDSETFRVEGLTCDRPMVKYSPLGRTRFELSYADAWRRFLEREQFDLVVACNVPLFTLARVKPWFERHNQPWLLWHQDLYSLGVGAEAARRLPGPLARIARTAVERTEAAQVRDASGVIAIASSMRDRYREWGVDREDACVVPNWAPIDEVTPGERDNSWARAHGLRPDALRLMYAGTLGRKHNPLLLLELLDATKARGVDAVLVVASEGCGADDLRVAAAGRADVVMVGYQPAEQLGDMLAAADAHLVLLEPDAAQFSVPSKVLTYLSAGRAIVALIPASNPAALDVAAVGGCVAPPTCVGAAEAAQWLAANSANGGFAKVGRAARTLAEQRFDINLIGDAFERAFERAAGARASVAMHPTPV